MLFLFVDFLFNEHVTHSCSFVGKRPQNSRSCRCHIWGPQRCKGTSCTRRSACHKRPCLTCLCCCCTGTAGSALRAERGCHSNPGHIPHIEHLNWMKKQNVKKTRVTIGGDMMIASWLLLFQLKYICNKNGCSAGRFKLFLGCMKPQEAENLWISRSRINKESWFTKKVMQTLLIRLDFAKS